MNSIKTYIGSLGRATQVLILALAVVFVSAGIAQAATTISTNVSTGGTLSVTGLSSLGKATSTMFSAHSAYFGTTATSTFSTAGALTLAGTLTASGLVKVAPDYSIDASSSGVLNIGTTTATTINIGRSGQVAALAGNATVAGTLGVTGATTLASTTATGMKVGQLGTRMTQIVSGYCVTAAAAITASTTTMLTCTPSAGASLLGATDRVMVMATSSLPGRVYLSSASSTAAGTIQVNAYNTAIDAGTVGSAIYAFNFWAFR